MRTLNTNNNLSLVESLSTADFAIRSFIKTWQKEYETQLKQIPLFDTEKTAQWTSQQKKCFARTFYHARGHFYKFLWLLGNKAPNAQFKSIILDNIKEEFAENGTSHEKLYYYFAEQLGEDVRKEFMSMASCTPEMLKFNNGHLEWLTKHDWNHCFAAFSAYEKLDNIDYLHLFKLAQSLNVTGKALTFFSVHVTVAHFENTLEELVKIWLVDPNIVKNSFKFITNHQISMWKSLSYAIFKQYN